MQCLWTAMMQSYCSFLVWFRQQLFKVFVPHSFEYRSGCVLYIIVHAEQKPLLQSKVFGTATQAVLYNLPVFGSFILTCLPVVYAEKPAVSVLLSQPFFKAVMVISCDWFLAGEELNIMADKFKYSSNQCVQSFVLCSPSFTGFYAASSLLSWMPFLPNRPQLCSIDYCPATKMCHQSSFYQRGP